MQPGRIPFDIPSAVDSLAHRVVCYEWGAGNAAQTVVCVHGLTRNGRDFDFLAEALAADFRVICPDMPGRGESQWLANPAAYNYATYVADMVYLLNALRLPKVHWVGTSMGGIIGMMLAQTLPGRISAIVLNDVGCLIPAEGLKRILSYAGVTMQFATRAEAELALRKNCAPFGITDERHWQHLFEHSLENLPDGTVRLDYDPAITAGLRNAEIKDIDLWSLWPAIQPLPTLLIRGEESDILTQGTAQAMKAQHPRLTLYEVPRTGHAPALMSVEQTSFIHQWLKGQN